jgi:FkbM family methyltransferase
MVGTSYSWALKHLRLPISSIVEVGSRDALDAIALGAALNCSVVSFEPNPEMLAVCKENLSIHEVEYVTLRPEALTDVDGPITFWKVEADRYPNPGASSLLEMDFSNRDRNDPELGRDAVQVPITVVGARWDSLGLPAPDLLLLDVEGAELKALRGFGAALTSVSQVIVELAPVSAQKGGARLRDVDRFLRKSGFRYVASDYYGAGRLRLWLRLAVSGLKWRLRNPWGRPRYRGLINAYYRRKSILS